MQDPRLERGMRGEFNVNPFKEVAPIDSSVQIAIGEFSAAAPNNESTIGPVLNSFAGQTGKTRTEKESFMFDVGLLHTAVTNSFTASVMSDIDIYAHMPNEIVSNWPR